MSFLIPITGLLVTLQSYPIKRRNILLVQGEVIIIQIFPLRPADLPPERIADVIGRKSDQ